MAETQTLKQISNDWYLCKNPDADQAWHFQKNWICWELLKEVRRTEVAFLGDGHARHRFYNIGKFSYLLKQLKLRFSEGSENAYWHFFKGIGLVEHSLRMSEGYDDAKRADLKHDFYEHLYGFTLNFDFDLPGKKELQTLPFLEAREKLPKLQEEILNNAVIPLSEFFDSYRAPYEVPTSGTGFHVRFAWETLAPYFKVSDYGRVSGLFGDWLLKKAGIPEKYIDAGAGHHSSGQALLRCVYSINPKTGLVALPLDDKKLKNFSWELAEPYHVLDTTRPIAGKAPRTYRRPGDLKELVEEFRGKHKKDITKARKAAPKMQNRKDRAIEQMTKILASLPEEDKKAVLEHINQEKPKVTEELVVDDQTEGGSRQER